VTSEFPLITGEENEGPSAGKSNCPEEQQTSTSFSTKGVLNDQVQRDHEITGRLVFIREAIFYL